MLKLNLLFFIVAFCNNIWMGDVIAQSKNIEYPTVLTNNYITSVETIDGEEARFYTFDVMEGILKITGEVISGYGGCRLIFSFLTLGHNEISNNDFWGDEIKKVTIREFSFPKEEKLILKISFNGKVTNAKFLLEGALNLNAVNASSGTTVSLPTLTPLPAQSTMPVSERAATSNINYGANNKNVDKLLYRSGKSTRLKLKQLTPDNSKIGLYVLIKNIETKINNGPAAYRLDNEYFIQLPKTIDDRVFSIMDNKFSPKFNEKAWLIVQDDPALVTKIKTKSKGYFYPAFTSDEQRLKVWWNIINEYNSQVSN